MSVTVKPERRTRNGWSSPYGDSPGRSGWYAEIELLIPEGKDAGKGVIFQVSKLDGEGPWTIDAAFKSSSSMPMWMNGFGARYLLTKTLNAELAADLDRLIGA
jgi:hypothetical protein